MMEPACSVVLMSICRCHFIPILETVHSYKIIRKQAAMFEFTVGAGRALVCTLQMEGDDPAQKYLLAQILEYMRRFRIPSPQMLSLRMRPNACCWEARH